MRAALAGIALALASLPARAEPDPCARSIHVTGRAQSVRAPDFAEITVGVEAKAPNPGAALDTASKAVESIVALGRDLGVPAGDIGTSAVVLEPTTRMVANPNGTSSSVPDGYRAVNTVSVRLAEMGRLGDLLRRALDGGANRIDSIGFGLSDPNRVEAELQVEAAKDARTRAVDLATAVGAKLGPLCSLQAVREPTVLYRSAPMAAKATSGRRVPIAAGTINSSAEVTASFAILP